MCEHSLLIPLDIDVAHRGVALSYQLLDLVYFSPHQARNAIGIVDAEFFELLVIIFDLVIRPAQTLLLVCLVEERGPIKLYFALDAIHTDVEYFGLEIDDTFDGRLRIQKLENGFAIIFGYGAT